MLNRGLNPMFVATMFDKDFAYINHAVRHNPNLCVAGGVTTKGNWMTKRFQDIDNFTGHKAKIHGLGYVTFPKMVQLPLASVDSSTWKTAPATYGTMVYFDGKKISQVSYHDILRGKFKLTPFLKQQLDEYGVSPTMFAKVEHHKKALSIEAYMSMVFMNKLQKYCKRHNLDYFLAVGSLNDLQNIVYIDENINNLTYEKFLKNCN